MNIDTSVKYEGPRGEVCSVTGSPLWGIEIDDVIAYYRNHYGWRVTYNDRPKTPYGLGPQVVSFKTKSGREVVWIPSYGGVLGQDWTYHQTREKTYWVIWKTGVRVLIVGGTSGITDWRLFDKSFPKDRLIEPGDIVFPWNFMTHSSHRGLVGTELETVWPRFDMTLDEPFCPELTKFALTKAREYERQGLVRKIHTPKEVRVGLVLPQGITFESDMEIKDWAARCKAMSALEPDLPPILSLHGDCLGPVFCRLAGIHELYIHYVANRAQGMPGNERLVETLHQLYCGNFRTVALDFEPWLLENVPIPDGKNCSCISSKHEAPEVFSKAMTQAK